MSYGQQSRNTESWNNDPNNFSNPGGPDNQQGNWDNNQQQYGQQYGSQRPTGDPTDTSNWTGESRRDFDSSGNPQPGQGQFWTPGQGDNYGSSGYQGNTSDINTPGAGGDFGGIGRGAGGAGDNWQSGDNNWQNRDTNYQQGDNDVAPGAGKASMGERLKGNAEKLAGRVTGNPSMVERGQIRKSGNPEDTSWNSNDN
ncbi:hypothetical protein BD414DRAFT_117125 [Trametes punicea]|nr:hypothetical protein BD414DRAFT_117125 [Trametes punicea]